MSRWWVFRHLLPYWHILQHLWTHEHAIFSYEKKKQSVSLPGGWITCRLLKFGIMDANVWKLTFLFILKILNDEQSYVSHSTYVSPGEVLLYFFFNAKLNTDHFFKPKFGEIFSKQCSFIARIILPKNWLKH